MADNPTMPPMNDEAMDTGMDDHEENDYGSSDDDDSEEEEMTELEIATELKDEGNDHFREKHYDQAVKFYSQALEKTQGAGNIPADFQAALHTNRAAAFISLQQFRDAVRDCDAALLIDAASKKALARKAQAQRLMGEVDKAQVTYQSLLALDSKSKTGARGIKDCAALTLQFNKAENLLEAKKYREAYTVAQASMQLAPDSLRMHKVKLKSMLEQGMHDQVTKYSTYLMRKKMDDNDILLIRARAFYWNSNFELAIKHLTQVLRRDPDFRPAQQQLRKLRKLQKTKLKGNQMFKTAQWLSAVAAYSECLKIEPQHKAFNSVISCNRAAALMKLHRLPEALQDVNRAVQCDATYTKAYLRRAQCLYEMGGQANLEACIRDYEFVIKKYGRGDVPRDIKRRFQQAKLALKRAKRKDYYKILGVNQRAQAPQLKKAYRKSAMKWHPDRHSGKSEAEKQLAEKNFKEINEAFDALSDPKKRARYDRGEDDLDGPQRGGMSQQDLFAQMFARAGGMGGFKF